MSGAFNSNGSAVNKERLWIRMDSKPVLLYEIRLQHHHPVVCLSVDDLACRPTSTSIRRYGVRPFALVFYPEGPRISVSFKHASNVSRALPNLRLPARWQHFPR